MDKLELYREQINKIDAQMAKLFEERLQVVYDIAEYKKANNMPIFVKEREAQVIEQNLKLINDQSISEYYPEFMQTLMNISRKYQSRLIEKDKNVITVNTVDGSYDILIGTDILKDISGHLQLDRKVLILTDKGVPTNYVEQLEKACNQHTTVILEQGEKSKNFDNYVAILTQMLNNGFTRNDCVVAMGGGMVGDLGGFVASTYMRGVDFYNIPTTFLAQVDSSIGGKVAINYNGIKNIIGAFYQPKKVIVDTKLLQTLDTRQLYAGVAESIKMAMTCDEKLFELIADKEHFNDNLTEIIKRSILVKKTIVEFDPFEQNVRAALNFGHTLGHAIESCSIGELLHGECVALGMVPFTAKDIQLALINVLKKYNLYTKTDVKSEYVYDFLRHDKKTCDDKIKTVWVEKIGTFNFKNLNLNQLQPLIEGLL